MSFRVALQEQPFDHPAHQIALQEMVEAVRVSRSSFHLVTGADRAGAADPEGRRADRCRDIRHRGW